MLDGTLLHWLLQESNLKPGRKFKSGGLELKSHASQTDNFEN